MKTTPEGNPIADYITVDDSALNKIKDLLSSRKESCEGIKVSVRTRGCSGLSYTIEYAIKDKNISKFDDVVELDGARVFIDPKISMYLIGSKMIFKSDDLESGFDFVNPNESSRCGCGESFKV